MERDEARGRTRNHGEIALYRTSIGCYEEKRKRERYKKRVEREIGMKRKETAETVEKATSVS